MKNKLKMLMISTTLLVIPLPSVIAYADEISKTSISSKSVISSEIYESDDSVKSETENFEDYYRSLEKAIQSKLRDTTIFGISIGTMIAMLISFFSEIYKIRKNKQNVADSQKLIKGVDNKITEYNDIVQALKIVAENNTEVVQKLTEEVKEKINQMLIEMNKTILSLNNYADVSTKFEKIILVLQAFAETKENTIEGVNEKVKEIIRKEGE